MPLTGQGGLVNKLIGLPVAPAPDQEKGLPNGAASTIHSGDGRPLSVRPLEPSVLVPSHDRLLIFRTLTGIDTVPVVASAGHTIRSAQNVGIYARVVRNETATRKSYVAVKILTTVCMALQIIFGAAVTALGASQGSYGAVTGLGAAGTIVGSFVAFVKGKGQPEKLSYAEGKWRFLRQYIEQRERELSLADCDLDVYEEALIIEEMFKSVKEELDSDRIPGQGQHQDSGVLGGMARGGAGGAGDGVSNAVSALRRRSAALGSKRVLENIEEKILARSDRHETDVSDDPDREEKTGAGTTSRSTGKDVCPTCSK